MSIERSQMSSLLEASRSNPRLGGPSFELRHRLLRLTWAVIWQLFGAWTPAPLHAWRRNLLRLFGAQIAPTAKVYPSVAVWYPPNLQMHDYACLGPDVICYCMDKIVIERHGLVSQGAYLCGGSHDVDDPHFQLIVGPIRICAEAWVAAEAFVGPGVVIGEGAVLGARAVTMKNLESRGIYAGNPARWIRDRKS